MNLDRWRMGALPSDPANGGALSLRYGLNDCPGKPVRYMEPLSGEALDVSFFSPTQRRG